MTFEEFGTAVDGLKEIAAKNRATLNVAIYDGLAVFNMEKDGRRSSRYFPLLELDGLKDRYPLMAVVMADLRTL